MGIGSECPVAIPRLETPIVVSESLVDGLYTIHELLVNDNERGETSTSLTRNFCSSLNDLPIRPEGLRVDGTLSETMSRSVFHL